MENKSLKFYYKYPQRDLKKGITSIKSKKVNKNIWETSVPSVLMSTTEKNSQKLKCDSTNEKITLRIEG